MGPGVGLEVAALGVDLDAAHEAAPVGPPVLLLGRPGSLLGRMGLDLGGQWPLQLRL